MELQEQKYALPKLPAGSSPTEWTAPQQITGQQFRFGEKTEKLLQLVTAVPVGFLVWEAQSTAVYKHSTPTMNAPGAYPLTSQQRLGDAIANMIGAANVKAIFPNWTGGADFHFNPIGWLNKYTIGGVIAVVADKLLKESPLYRGLPVVSSVVSGVGYGALVGGIIGGIFDPPADSGFTVTKSREVAGLDSGVATGNVPYGRSGASNTMSVLN